MRTADEIYQQHFDDMHGCCVVTKEQIRAIQADALKHAADFVDDNAVGSHLSRQNHFRTACKLRDEAAQLEKNAKAPHSP